MTLDLRTILDSLQFLGVDGEPFLGRRYANAVAVNSLRHWLCQCFPWQASNSDSAPAEPVAHNAITRQLPALLSRLLLPDLLKIPADSGRFHYDDGTDCDTCAVFEASFRQTR